jgi:hypothetical protein
MAVAYVSIGTVSISASTTTVTPALPASMAAGDLMVCFVSVNGGSSAFNTPAGWTKIGPWIQGTTGAGVWYYRFWQSGDTAPVITWTTANGVNACIARYTGAGAVGAIGTVTAGTSTTQNFVGVTTTAANSMVIVSLESQDSPVATGPGGSWASQFSQVDATNIINIQVVGQTFASSGSASGTGSWTSGGNTEFGTVSIELQIAAGGDTLIPRSALIFM